MKLETITSPTTEVFLETSGGCSAVANPWFNCEGATFMLNDKNGCVKVAGCLRWEEIDALLIVLTAVRST